MIQMLIESISTNAGVIVALIVGLASAAVVADAKMTKSRKREVELSRAIHALRRHYDAMTRLDDPSVPSEVLDLALRFNSVIIHPDLATAVMEAGKQDTDRSKSTRREDVGGKNDHSAFVAAYRELEATRPDLAAAFVESMVAGMQAFLLRWPECAAVLGGTLVDMASHPAEEAFRITRAAEAIESKKRGDWTDGNRPQMVAA